MKPPLPSPPLVVERALGNKRWLFTPCRLPLAGALARPRLAAACARAGGLAVLQVGIDTRPIHALAQPAAESLDLSVAQCDRLAERGLDDRAPPDGHRVEILAQLAADVGSVIARHVGGRSRP